MESDGTIICLYILPHPSGMLEFVDVMVKSLLRHY